MWGKGRAGLEIKIISFLVRSVDEDIDYINNGGIACLETGYPLR